MTRPVEPTGESRNDARGHDARGTYYELNGTASDTPLVLVHGVGLDHTMWDEHVARLAPTQSVLRYDLLGHGRSKTPTGSLEDFVEQLDTLLGYLRIERVCLAGFSLGGVVAQRYAADHPERVARLVLLYTVYRRSEKELEGVRARLRLTEEQGPAATVDAAISRWFSPQFQHGRPEVIDAVRQRLLSNDVQSFLAAYRVFVNADDAIGDALFKVQCPTLVMTGELDVGSTPAMAHRMAKDLGDAQVVVLPGLRHMGPVEDVERTVAELRDFCRG